MKIALFSDTYSPEINGVAIHVAALKEGLENLGHEVLVVTTNPKVSIIKDAITKITIPKNVLLLKNAALFAKNDLKLKSGLSLFFRIIFTILIARQITIIPIITFGHTSGIKLEGFFK